MKKREFLSLTLAAITLAMVSCDGGNTESDNTATDTIAIATPEVTEAPQTSAVNMIRSIKSYDTGTASEYQINEFAYNSDGNLISVTKNEYQGGNLEQTVQNTVSYDDRNITVTNEFFKETYTVNSEGLIERHDVESKNEEEGVNWYETFSYENNKLAQAETFTELSGVCRYTWQGDNYTSILSESEGSQAMTEYSYSDIDDNYSIDILSFMLFTDINNLSLPGAKAMKSAKLPSEGIELCSMYDDNDELTMQEVGKTTYIYDTDSEGRVTKVTMNVYIRESDKPVRVRISEITY